jgi:lipopolysaccharide transport system ATP-binding protein
MGTITITHLGKAYKQYPSRWIRLKEWLIPFSKPRHKLKWVLQDIFFTVSPGEAVGIIGINGAGKSTLLKMITGTTLPTTGSVNITGRVAALLELGMGFHPDFTGRQNVFMAGQLLGLSIEEISSLMPEIEAFAEIGDYMDQPVRVYSSGMQMRVAFSVATARRPDVLIVDEALSVGDAYFQHKSFDRIRKFRSQGTTLLIVSHDKQAIQSICDRAILLDGGKMVKQGAPEAVMDYYNAIIAQKENTKIEQAILDCGKIQTISGTGEAEIESAAVFNGEGVAIEVVKVGEVVTLQLVAKINTDLPKIVLGYLIKDRLGQPVFGTTSADHKIELSDLKRDTKVNFSIKFPMNIGVGTYSVSTALALGKSHLEGNLQWRDLVLTFNVINHAKPSFIGVSWIEPEISATRAEREK